MKIRIKGNSIRFRLTKTEVAQLTKTGAIEENTIIGNTTFKYAVIMDMNASHSNLHAHFFNQKITLYLPKDLGTDWFESDRVGFEDYQKDLHLLLEKDFTCLENREEDQSDNYPNPKLIPKS